MKEENKQTDSIKEKNQDNRIEQLKRKWLLTSGIGLSLVGAGLCVFAEAAFLKYENASFGTWFAWGLFSLILINGGLAVFGNAITQKSFIDSRKRLKNRNSNFRKRGPRKPKPPRKPKHKKADA